MLQNVIQRLAKEGGLRCIRELVEQDFNSMGACRTGLQQHDAVEESECCQVSSRPISGDNLASRCPCIFGFGTVGRDDLQRFIWQEGCVLQAFSASSPTFLQQATTAKLELSIWKSLRLSSP